MGRANLTPSGIELPHVLRHIASMHDAILRESWAEAYVHAKDASIDLRYVRRWLKEKAESDLDSAWTALARG